jgi:hypothetical protein
LLRFRVPQEEDALTQDQREELKELFLESCNAVNILNADLCDPHAQELDFIKEITYIDPSSFPLFYPIDTSNEVVSLFEDPATIYLMMYVAGHCHDCDDKTNLFDKESSPSRRNAKLRRLEEENHVCLCPFDVPSWSSTRTEFFEEYSNTLEDLSFASSLVEVNELDPVSCYNGIVSFNKMVIVELEICDIFNSTIIESEDFGILEDAFVSTHNGLAMEYCDPYFRTLQTAWIIQQGSFTPAGHLPVEIQVTGKCRGCNPETTHIYGGPNGCLLPVSVSCCWNVTVPFLLGWSLWRWRK